ncbi:hypothetical protein [Croceibacterium ferulae]|uniref:hypothetical protein n=1 Tax=Croceibacterium ferulae TaxID=1854641 RepID=UPI0012D7BBBA|nr:hypothetical protein [Croceibacterium ferulae]
MIDPQIASVVIDTAEALQTQLTGSAAADLPIVAASALLLRAWGKTMHAALTACADNN